MLRNGKKQWKTISEEEINKRFITNPELVTEYEQREKHHAACLHYASWEWLLALNKKNYLSCGAYKKLANKYFDKLVIDIRS
jgi:KDO2-lipid IV(A) lauroyltransferase